MKYLLLILLIINSKAKLISFGIKIDKYTLKILNRTKDYKDSINHQNPLIMEKERVHITF